jgi:hypothetical protein
MEGEQHKEICRDTDTDQGTQARRRAAFELYKRKKAVEPYAESVVE